MTVKSRIKTWIRIIIMEYYVMSCGCHVDGPCAGGKEYIVMVDL